MATKSGAPNPGRKSPPAKAVGKAAAAKVRPAKGTAAKANTTRATAPKSPAAKPTSSRSAVATIEPDDLAFADEQDADPSADGAAPPVAERKPWPIRLYLGEIGYDFIGKRRFWYTVSAVLILICLASMIFREFNLGVEFAGGERFRTPGSEQQLTEVTTAVEALGAQVTSAQAVGNNQLVVITADLPEDLTAQVSQAIADTLGVNPSDVTNSTTSASWGRDVTSKALQGLLVFMVLVLVFLAVRFQWKMAAGAMVALVHDLVITAGVYSIVGFEVTPASVIGLLTILGFSLYDTVVVFDKVDENAKGLLTSQRRTYSESANLAINQVLMRSINTSIFALLPVLGLLYAGVFLIGEGTLQDLALVLFVGMLAGVYSSIFLAAPVLCDLKEREPEYQKLAKRLTARRAGTAVDQVGNPKAATAKVEYAPAQAVRASRSKASVARASSASSSVTSSPEDDDSETNTADEAIVSDRDEDDDTAETPSGPPVVASARRSRPRGARTPAAATSATPATAAQPEPTKPEAAPATTSESAGSRLAPRPGAKPTRGTRPRKGSAKSSR